MRAIATMIACAAAATTTVTVGPAMSVAKITNRKFGIRLARLAGRPRHARASVRAIFVDAPLMEQVNSRYYTGTPSTAARRTAALSSAAPKALLIRVQDRRWRTLDAHRRMACSVCRSCE